MEDMKDKEGMGGKCMMCGGDHGCCGCFSWGGGHRHHGPWRLIIRIIIIIIVFWAGTQFGELKAYRGAYMMGGYGGGYYDQGYDQNGGGYGPNMMYRVISTQGTSQSASQGTTTGL